MGLIDGAIKLAGGIFGGIKASQAAKKVKSNLESQQRENQAWYDRNYNTDPTQLAAAQRMMTNTQKAFDERLKGLRGGSAVSGATEEAVAQSKAAAAGALTDAASQTAAAAQSRLDSIDAQYRQRDSELQNALNQTELGKAQAISQAVQGLGATSIFDGSTVFGKEGDKKVSFKELL